MPNNSIEQAILDTFRDINEKEFKSLERISHNFEVKCVRCIYMPNNEINIVIKEMQPTTGKSNKETT